MIKKTLMLIKCLCLLVICAGLYQNRSFFLEYSLVDQDDNAKQRSYQSLGLKDNNIWRALNVAFLSSKKFFPENISQEISEVSLCAYWKINCYQYRSEKVQGAYAVKLDQQKFLMSSQGELLPDMSEGVTLPILEVKGTRNLGYEASRARLEYLQLYFKELKKNVSAEELPSSALSLGEDGLLIFVSGKQKVRFIMPAYDFHKESLDSELSKKMLKTLQGVEQGIFQIDKMSAFDLRFGNYVVQKRI